MPILFKQKKLNLFIEQGLKDDVPKEISDAWELIVLAPVFPIYQSGGKTRVVTDFREKNKFLIFQPDAIPPVDLLIQILYPYTIYSTLDLKSAYYNVPLDIKDARIGITTIHGNYQFGKLPFGLASFPAVFARLIRYIITDLHQLIFSNAIWMIVEIFI